MSLYGMFALMVLVEMLVFFWVASSIGWGWALLIVLGTAVIGGMVVRRAGVAAFRRVRDKIDRREMPGRELSEGFTLLVAGIFLITPGFIADVAGLLLLVPAVREVVYRFSSKRVGRRFTVITTTYSSGGRPVLRDPSQGEIVDVEPEDRP